MSLAPGPGALASLASLGPFRRDPLGVLQRWATTHGDVVRVGRGPRTFHLLCHPEHIAHVLKQNQRNYSKRAIGYRQLSFVLGDGLLTSEGEPWRERRRIVQPAFHRERLSGFARTMTARAQATRAAWSGREVVDVAAEMMGLTFRIVGEALMGADLDHLDQNAVGDDVTLVMGHVADRMMRLVSWPSWVPTRGALEFRRAVRRFDDLVYRGLAERRAEGRPRDDLMSMLVEARDETGAGLTDQEIRDEVMTIMGAGHETTASALSWTWWLLSQHPDAERALHAELATVLAGRAPVLEDVPRLVYTGALVKEAMRLYPPVWILARRAIRRDVVGGYAIPAGSTVLVSPYVTHRHPALWVDPEAFRPERFCDATLDGAAYFPFGAGPRMCVGAQFASMEATIIVAMLAQRYRLLPLGEAPVPHPTVTLRPRDPLQMRPILRPEVEPTTPRHDRGTSCALRTAHGG